MNISIIVIQTDVFWPCFKCKQTTVILYSVKKDLIPRCTIMRFANRILPRRSTIMRFANRKLIGLVIKTKLRWSRKLVKSVRFGQQRLIENWVNNQLDIQYWIDNQSFKTQFQCFYNIKMPLNIVPNFLRFGDLIDDLLFPAFQSHWNESAHVSITYELRIRFKIVRWFSFLNNLPHAKI